MMAGVDTRAPRHRQQRKSRGWRPRRAAPYGVDDGPVARVTTSASTACGRSIRQLVAEGRAVTGNFLMRASPTYALTHV